MISLFFSFHSSFPPSFIPFFLSFLEIAKLKHMYVQMCSDSLQKSAMIPCLEIDSRLTWKVWRARSILGCWYLLGFPLSRDDGGPPRGPKFVSCNEEVLLAFYREYT